MNSPVAAIHPVILAGGSGTRLWPLSRQNYPKQFLKLNSTHSLLQETALRCQGLSDAPLLLISNEAHYFLCQEQMQDLALSCEYLLEPCPRNTAPALAVAAFHLSARYGASALMLVLPSDHHIANQAAFQKTMSNAAHYALAHQVIMTFGIKPDSPATGYGYIEMGDMLANQVHAIQSFREKPDETTALSFVQQGHYYWNSGIFLCQAGVYLDELKRFAPEIYEGACKAYEASHQHQDFIRLSEPMFSACPSDSIDYAVMEHTHAACMMILDSDWSDLGCWNAVADNQSKDINGNSLSGRVLVKDTSNTLVSSQDLLVTTIGIKDQIIVATQDAVLVADKQYAQQVKDMVATLSEENGELARDHRRVMRPWGWYEVLSEGRQFKVKRLMVKPGARLSLQMHQQRAEHWVVAEGMAEVVNDGKEFILHANQSTYIPKKTRHRLSNPSSLPLYVIEVQSGDYLGEDDITRYDDVYDRLPLGV